MDTLADEMDQVMARLERAGMARCPPKLNSKGDPAKHLGTKNAPWAKLANEKPKGKTINYDGEGSPAVPLDLHHPPPGEQLHP